MVGSRSFALATLSPILTLCTIRKSQLQSLLRFLTNWSTALLAVLSLPIQTIKKALLSLLKLEGSHRAWRQGADSILKNRCSIQHPISCF